MSFCSRVFRFVNLLLLGCNSKLPLEEGTAKTWLCALQLKEILSWN